MPNAAKNVTDLSNGSMPDLTRGSIFFIGAATDFANVRHVLQF